ncbi:MAG: LytR C-terminal domain-containing protein [bacterium]
MKRGPLVLIAVLGFVVVGAGAYVIEWRQRPTVAHAPTATGAGTTSAPNAPRGVRIRVAVLNTTHTRGLARRATRVLRDQGFDVVEMGTASPLRDTTLVLDRSGHPAWAAAVAKSLGAAARTEARPDSSRYLDITVLLGSSWHPPAQPLDP